MTGQSLNSLSWTIVTQRCESLTSFLNLPSQWTLRVTSTKTSRSNTPRDIIFSVWESDMLMARCVCLVSVPSMIVLSGQSSENTCLDIIDSLLTTANSIGRDSTSTQVLCAFGSIQCWPRMSWTNDGDYIPSSTSQSSF